MLWNAISRNLDEIFKVKQYSKFLEPPLKKDPRSKHWCKMNQNDQETYISREYCV